MPSSSATDNPRLLNHWALLVVAMVAGVVLWATLQKEEVFAPNGQGADEVSAGYAEVLLGAYPHNQTLRTQLLDLLLQLGDFERAQQHLDSWPNPDRNLQAFYQLAHDAGLLSSADETSGRVHAEDLAARLRALDYSALPTRQLQQLATLALGVQVPGVAADSYRELAGREPQRAPHWLGEAARWYLASQQPDHAAQLYVQLLGESQDLALRQQYLVKAFNSLLAADRGEQAVELLAAEIKAQPETLFEPTMLDQAVGAAIGYQQPELAGQFFALWRRQQPESAEVWRKELQQRLAFGDLAGARHAGEQLLVQAPDDPELLRQVALVAEWQHDYPAALNHWLALLKRQDEPGLYEHVWRLALQGPTDDTGYEQGIALLASIRETRPLTDTELDALVYAEQTRGTPENAEQWLQGYAQQHAGHRLAWVRLLQNLEDSRQYDKRLEVWNRYAERFPLTMRERMDWASNHLRRSDPQAAWRVINGVDSRTVDDLDYWRARSTLAWELGLDDELRHGLERTLALQGHLDSGDESALINLYRNAAPQKALHLAVDSWHRTGEPDRLAYALQLAQELQEWDQVASLLQAACAAPRVAGHADVLAAGGALAQQRNQPEEAERLYRLGLQRYPDDLRFRERLLWLYVDQGRRDDFTPLLQQWRGLARDSSSLWLPFAAASQQLGRRREALAWYGRYLKHNKADWLVLAAYADALEAGGYADRAQRLRLRLIRDMSPQRITATPQGYATWLRLLASSYSSRKAQAQALQWQDGSQPMLQLWFEQMLARLDSLGQSKQKDPWLAWARSRGLRIERFEQVQEILRGHDRKALETLVASGGLDAGLRVEALTTLGRPADALATALGELGGEQSQARREQLRQQAISLTEATPQGLRAGWRRQDYGGLVFDGPRASLAHYLGKEWYAQLDLEQGRYSGDLLESSALGTERNATLTLQRPLADGTVNLLLDASLRDDDNRTGLGLSRSWRLTPGDVLEAGADWQRKNEDTGLMLALGQQNDLWLGGRHRISPRDQLSWRLAQRWFETRAGDDLGSGQQVRLEYLHMLQFAGPSWALRSGIDYQHNRLDSPSLDHLASSQGGAIELAGLGLDNPGQLTAKDLLPDRYGQVYVGSTWRRGFPGAFNRTRGQYTWLIDLNAGWQWVDNTFNYGVSTGIGMEVIGDDELALTLGYQSAPEGGAGQSGGTVGLSYALRFGR
ncbi:MAG TPA: tetratricopeptide repeat protein, partial [Pseudomonas sp.]|uniref:tetratricopeptide repeat protein n=1 Tax=Pseudomonas sp. TaxID=306 RepID=UPI002B460B96